MKEIQSKTLRVVENLVDRLESEEITPPVFLVAMDAAFNTVSGFLDDGTVRMISDFIREVSAMEKEKKPCQ